MGSQVAAITTDFQPGQHSPPPRRRHQHGDQRRQLLRFEIHRRPADSPRDGTFTLNGSNQLVTDSVAFVKGFGFDANGNLIWGGLQNLSIALGRDTEGPPRQITLHLEGNLNATAARRQRRLNHSSQAFSTVAGTAPTGADLLTQSCNHRRPPTAMLNPRRRSHTHRHAWLRAPPGRQFLHRHRYFQPSAI